MGINVRINTPMARPRKHEGTLRKRAHVTLDPVVLRESDLVAFFRLTDRSGLVERLLKLEIAAAKAELAAERPPRTLDDIRLEWSRARNAQLVDLGEPTSVSREELNARAVEKLTARRPAVG